MVWFASSFWSQKSVFVFFFPFVQLHFVPVLNVESTKKIYFIETHLKCWICDCLIVFSLNKFSLRRW